MSDREFTNINGIKVCDQTARNNIPTKTSQLENDSNFVTDSVVDEKISNAQLNGGEEVDLSSYAKITDLPTKTSQLTNDSGYITNIPDEYITETELNATGYATTSQIPTVPTNVSEFTNDAHYASETFVTNKIAEASLSGGEVDLSGYVTKETGNANQITFADGETFQDKLDNGTLKGENGDANNVSITRINDGDTFSLDYSGGGEIITYTVTNNLTNVNTSNATNSVNKNSTYRATLTAHSGYTLNNPTITMGGSDITSTVYSNGTITINSVTGNIVITCTATENSSGPATYTITNNLTNCTTTNSSSSIEEGSLYTSTINPNDGYTLSNVTVTMGGIDITSSSFSENTITISSVTGNIVITANATENSGGGANLNKLLDLDFSGTPGDYSRFSSYDTKTKVGIIADSSGNGNYATVTMGGNENYILSCLLENCLNCEKLEINNNSDFRIKDFTVDINYGEELVLNSSAKLLAQCDAADSRNASYGWAISATDANKIILRWNYDVLYIETEVVDYSILRITLSVSQTDGAKIYINGVLCGTCNFNSSAHFNTKNGFQINGLNVRRVKFYDMPISPSEIDAMEV